MYSSKCFHLCSSIKHLQNSHCTNFAIFEGVMNYQTYSPAAYVYSLSNCRDTNPWSSWTTTLTWSKLFTIAKVVGWQAWSSSTTLVLPFIKLSPYTNTLSPHCTDILLWISDGLTPYAYRNLITAHYSLMVQLQSGADNSDWVQVTGKTLQDLLNNMVGMIHTGECSDKGSYNC
jgi:hypothetical protein